MKIKKTTAWGHLYTVNCRLTFMFCYFIYQIHIIQAIKIKLYELLEYI